MMLRGQLPFVPLLTSCQIPIVKDEYLGRTFFIFAFLMTGLRACSFNEYRSRNSCISEMNSAG
jgi:hypothetical protein